MAYLSNVLLGIVNLCFSEAELLLAALVLGLLFVRGRIQSGAAFSRVHPA